MLVLGSFDIEVGSTGLWVPLAAIFVEGGALSQVPVAGIVVVDIGGNNIGADFRVDDAWVVVAGFMVERAWVVVVDFMVEGACTVVGDFMVQ